MAHLGLCLDDQPLVESSLTLAPGANNLVWLDELWISRGAPMPPELNLKRAVFVLGKIDEILAWDKGRLHERDLRFVDLGRYLGEVRAGQYWPLEKMKSFDEPES